MAIRNFPRQIEIALIEIEFLVADLSAIVDMRSLSEKLRELLAHLRAAVQARAVRALAQPTPSTSTL